MLFATKQAVDRLAEVLSFQIPQGHVDGGHGRDCDRRAAEIHRFAMHFLPQPLGFQWVFADQKLPQATRNIMAEWGIDDRFDHFGL